MQFVKTQEWWRKDFIDHSQECRERVDIDGSHVERNLLCEIHVKETNLPFYALLLFSFILLLAPQQIFPVLAPLRIAMMSILLATVVHAVSRISRDMPVIYLPRGVVLALALMVWAILSIPFSLWPSGSLAFLGEQYVKTVIVFLLISSVINTRERLTGITWALVVMAIPLSLTAINNLLSGVTMSGSHRIVGYDAPLAENPNDMALLLNLLLPLAIALLLSVKAMAKKWFIGSVIAVMVIAIVATFSRAGFLTLIVTFMCYLFLLRNRPERFLAPVILVIAIFALPFLPGDYMGRLGTITHFESDQTGSAQIRIRDTREALSLVSMRPLMGSGVGMNMLAMNDVRGATWVEIHNVYLMLAVELGLPGLLLFIMLLWAALKSAHAMQARTRNTRQFQDLFNLAQGLKVSLIAFSVAAFFHPVAYHFYFYYMAGLSLALSQINVSETTGSIS